MDFITLSEIVGAKMNSGTGAEETSLVHGHYDIECRDSAGNLLWSDGFDNVVTIGGKNELLVSGVYNLTGSYMGLISAVGYTAVSGTDTMGSHSGWTEASSGTPPGYGNTRPAVSWSALPTTGQLVSAAATYVASGASGTIEGAFIVTGGTSAVGNTTGVLFSAGALTTPQPVVAGNTVTMTYTLNLT
jgi:hypothetical protein